MVYIKFLEELKQPDISLTGGKAANLGVLVNFKLPVPGGFCITTDGYRAFLKHNKLEQKIKDALGMTNIDDIKSLEDASQNIRNLFTSGSMPGDVGKEICAAYEKLNGFIDYESDTPVPVAVRSSATAEDLPDMSFAGQQDTYLNICSAEKLIESVVKCWGSLWTARAIGYRRRNKVSQDEISLAVVVQRMIQSEVSGVMFTANPLTGKRTEIVIDASFGLGEAIVSGQVEPDNYIIDIKYSKIINKTIGEKLLSIRSQGRDGVAVCREGASTVQALSDEKIIELAILGQKTAMFFKAPQDIEWAFADGTLYLLQSRPITSLYPIPENNRNDGVSKDELKAFFSFASWQVMMDPITPFGRDLFYGVAAAVGKRTGYSKGLYNQNVFYSAGERLYINITPLIRNKTGRKLADIFLSSIDPEASHSLEYIFKEPHFDVKKSHMNIKKEILLLGIALKTIYTVITNLISPSMGIKRLNKKIDLNLKFIDSKTHDIVNIYEFIDFLEMFLMKKSSSLLIYLPPCVASGQVPLQILMRMVSKLPEGSEKIMDLSRGLNNNVTTEMDLNLWKAASEIKGSSICCEHFLARDAQVLSEEYIEKRLPEPVQTKIWEFLKVYGVRGVGEIDIGRKRWAEDPTHIMQVIKSYLKIDESASPEVVFERSGKRAQNAEEALLKEMKEASWGFFKIKRSRFLIDRYRKLGGLREAPKFAIVKIFNLLRIKLLELGYGLKMDGIIENPDDVFYLKLSELKDLKSAEASAIKQRIIERREKVEFEKRRKSIPSLILSDGTVYFGQGDSKKAEDGNILKGTPVSAGMAEGTVRVILDPYSTMLQPGEILVCPATDPAWTPLFLAAAGLIMEVGGLMTHGSVVAREYGIPAVVGVKQATSRLRTGQRVRINGNNGEIEIIE